MSADVQWNLIAWHSYDPETKTHKTTFLRDAHQSEVDDHQEAVELLNAFLSRSAYADYLEATSALHKAIEAAESAWCDARGATPDLRPLHSAVKTWLAALRSFDDRTSTGLSARFDKGLVYDAFKSALSEEYNRNFAYRLAYALRNISEHADAVLNHIQMSSKEMPDGRADHSLSLGFDAADLVARFPKLKATVLDELSEFGGRLGLESVVGHATQTIERTMATALLAAQSDLRSALHTVEAFQAEAEAVGAPAGNFMTTLVPPGNNVSLVWIAIHIARTVRDNLDASRALLALPALVVTAPDLVL